MARNANAPKPGPALRAQLAAEGAQVWAKYGPQLGWTELLTLLQDPTCVRFPCDLRFDAGPLLPGEFAHALPKGQKPEEGFTIYVHPLYERQLQSVPYLVLHQLVLVNYGHSASAEDAETFGACALGLSKDEYYRALCDLSGQIGGDDLV